MNADVGVGCSLFYVDDDPDDLELFKSTASSIGESVCVFEFGDLMLYALHNPPPEPSIIFVDINMPTKNGFEVMQEIKAAPNLQKLPIVVYSTTSHVETINRCRDLGASLYVTKPTRIDDLREIIRYVVNVDWKNHEVTNDNFVYGRKR